MRTRLFTLMLLFFTNANAQDVIVKTDKSEIKSKVSEITESSVKYKKWDNLDGPIYNINTSDVFMIIYANGQREIINKSSNNQPASIIKSKEDATSNPESGLAAQLKQTPSSQIDTTIDYKNIKVKYKPTRVCANLQSPISIGIEREFRIVKNIFNIGFAYYYTFPKDKDILQSNFGFLYASLYAPINRLTGNYEHQDKGLFIFGHAGYGATSLQYLDFDGKTQSVTSGNFTWRIGADYFITKGFGISFSSFEFKSFYGGLAFSF